MPTHIDNRMVLAVVAALAAASCQPDELPEISWEGDNIRFATTQDELPCGKTLEVLDQRVAEIEAALDQPLPAGKKITYYYLPGEMDLSPCPSDADACCDGLVVYTDDPIEEHELVHAVLSPIGRRTPFFEEGMAVLYGYEAFCPGVWSDGEAAKETAEALIDNFERSSGNILFAGAFATYFAETYGRPALKAVYDGLSASAGTDEVASVVAAELGVDFQTVLDGFAEEMTTYDGCFGSAMACLESEIYIPASDLPWTYRAELDCDDESTTGPYLEEVPSYVTPRLLHTVKLVVPASDQPYVLDIEKSPGWKCNTYLRRCGFPLFDAEIHFDEDDTAIDAAAEITAGEYELLIELVSEGAADVRDDRNRWIDLAFDTAVP